MTEPNSMLEKTLRQRAGNRAERIADLGAKQAHDRDHNDGDKGENNCILN